MILSWSFSHHLGVLGSPLVPVECDGLTHVRRVKILCRGGSSLRVPFFARCLAFTSGSGTVDPRRYVEGV